MPDPILILGAMGAAGITAAAALLFLGLPGRGPHPVRMSVAGVLGVGLGFAVGSWRLGVRLRWPPLEHLDRLLLILFPAVLCLELIAALFGSIRWAAWLPRCVVAVGAAPVLLYNTSYLADLSGPGSREWTPAQT